MELILSTDIAKTIPQAIDFNFDEIKAYLAENLERYQNLVVTEDAIQPAKKDRATLNKLKDAIEGKRKDVKKACLAPYEDFERKIKELVGMIQHPIDTIDAQLKVFDEQKKNAKYAAIEECYNQYIGDLAELLPLDRIIPPKWANAGENIVLVNQSVLDAIFKVQKNMEILRAMKMEHEQAVLDIYLKTLDMGAALDENKRLEEQKKALESQKAQAAIQASAPKPEPVVVQPVAPVQTLKEDAKTIKVIFYDTTEAFRHEMRELTQKHNIKYGGIQ